MSESQTLGDDNLSISNKKSTDAISDEEITMPSSVSDAEQQPQPLPTDHQILVEWDDGDNDPLNPRSLPSLRKWLYVLIVSASSLLITCASSIYSMCYTQVTEEFNCSEEVAILGLSFFVIGLAISPMVSSPLSEFYGRRNIYIISITLFIIWTIPCAVAQNIETLIVGRFFCGIAGSAFLTVAPATVVDLFAPAHMQAPMMLFTITPFLGPVLGPVIGGFINQFTSWRWTFYILIIWSTTMLVCLIFVPETYHPVLLARKAVALRKEMGSSAYRSASEIANAKRSVAKTILHSLYRPFQLLLLEPMILCLSIYSALLLGILYLFFGAFPLVFQTIHGFNLWQKGLSFLGIGVGMLFACLSNPFWRKNYLRLIANWKKIQGSEKGNAMLKPEPEFRLPPAIAGGILVPIGMFWFGWTTYKSIHWIVPILGSVLFGAGIFLTFSGVFTFLVDAYPTYAASAMASNTFTRCMFAAAFPLFGQQMYDKLDYQWATSLLSFLALAMMPFPYLFFRYGKILRSRSRFAFS